MSVDWLVEHRVLDVLVLVAYVLAPRMTAQFFLNTDRRYVIAHAVALVAVVVALFGVAVAAPLWGIFCVGGFALHLQRSRASLLSLTGAASCVPFAFSIISAIWFVAGTNDLHLLGYNRAWSFYAVLHGSILGWLFLGSVAHLAVRHGQGGRPTSSTAHAIACLASFLLFLCVAFGIDGVPYIKRLGVVGFAVVVPAVIGAFAFTARGAARWWALMSFAGIVASMALALANEFWVAFPRVLAGMPTMVLAHGALNALVVVPCFFFAVRVDASRSAS